MTLLQKPIGLRRFGLAFTAALVLCRGEASAEPSPTTPSVLTEMAGVWSSHSDFGPKLRGTVTVRRTPSGYAAQIGAESLHSATLDFVFSDGSRLHTAPQRQQGCDRAGNANTAHSADTTAPVCAGEALASPTFTAWWDQPPGPAGQGYTTPIRMARVGDQVWRGEASPLAQNFDLFVKITQDESGRWIGAFRNPQYNMNGGVSRFLLTHASSQLRFSSPDGATVRTATLVQSTQAQGGKSFVISWPPLPQAVTMRPASRADLAQWSPRLAHEAARYRQPQQIGDGWRTARARSVGFDEAKLSAAIAQIAHSDPAAQRPSLVHAVLVARHNRLVMEEYFHGNTRTTPHDIRSMGKSLASVLLGAAIGHGATLSAESRIADFFDDRSALATADSRKGEITLAHLLSHSSGLACNDMDEDSPGAEGAMQSQASQPDWWRYTIDLPMAHAPGARYAYCTAGVNLVGAALSRITRQSIPALFDTLLAQPLSFGRYHWNLTPTGEGYLGGGAHLLPRDMLKIGQLMLDRGVWDGQRIVPAEWVDTSTRASIAIDEATTGMDAARFAAVATRGADGLGWHRYGVQVGQTQMEAFEANGNGGQFLIVVPELDAAVVVMGGNFGQGGIWTKWRDQFVGASLLGAIQ